MALPSLVARRRVVLTSIERRLPDPRSLTSAGREAVRDRGLRLRLSAPGLVAARRSGLQMASQRLGGAVHRALSSLRSRAERVTGRVSEAPLRSALREARAHLAGLGPRLDAGVAARVVAAGLCAGDDAGWSAGDQCRLGQTRWPAAAALRRRRGGCRGPGSRPARGRQSGAQGGAPRSRPAAAQEALDL